MLRIRLCFTTILLLVAATPIDGCSCISECAGGTSASVANDGSTTIVVAIDTGFGPADAALETVSIAPGEVALIASEGGLGGNGCDQTTPGTFSALEVRRTGSTTTTTITPNDARWTSTTVGCGGRDACGGRDFTLHLDDQDVPP